MIWLVRIVLWIVGLAAVPAVVALAVANRESLTLSLAPVPYVVEAPSYLIVLGGVAVGFLWGGLMAWLSGAKARREARRSRWEASKAKREAASLRDHVMALETAKATAPATPALPAKADAA